MTSLSGRLRASLQKCPFSHRVHVALLEKELRFTKLDVASGDPAFNMEQFQGLYSLASPDPSAPAKVTRPTLVTKATYKCRIPYVK